MSDPILSNPLVVWVPTYPSLNFGVGARFGGPFTDGSVYSTLKFDFVTMRLTAGSAMSHGAFNINDSPNSPSVVPNMQFAPLNTFPPLVPGTGSNVILDHEGVEYRFGIGNRDSNSYLWIKLVNAAQFLETHTQNLFGAWLRGALTTDREQILAGVPEEERGRTIVTLDNASRIDPFNEVFLPHCFARNTLIRCADGSERPIQDVRPGDVVLAFDGGANATDRPLVARRVVRMLTGVTTEWLKLTFDDCHQHLIVTPGHRFLAAQGDFRRIDEIIADDGCIVRADGSIILVTAERIIYSVETAHLYEQDEVIEYASVGNTALRPEVKRGWKTYNFEVEGLHTYVAGGVRVHNDSTFTLVAAATEFQQKIGHAFSGSQQDVALMMGAIADGRITAYGDYVPALGDERYTGPAFDLLHNKIVTSVSELGFSTSTITADRITRITEFETGGASVSRDFDAFHQFGWDSRITGYDTAGGINYSIEIADNGTVSAAQVNGVGVDLGSIGSLLGSQLGSRLGGNTFAKVAAGTLLGTVGREVGNLLQYGTPVSLLAPPSGSGGQPALLDTAVNGALEAHGSFSGNLAGNLVAQLVSPLIAELAKQLNLDGLGGAVFTTVGTSITQQLVTNAFNVVVHGTDAAGLAYTMFDGFASGSFFTNMAGAIGAHFGSYLAAAVAAPSSQEGALGQQIGSSVGAFIGSTIAGPIGSFIGSFVGGVIGGQLGAQFGNDPESGGRIELTAEGQFDIVGRWQDHGGSFQWLDVMARHQIITAYELVNLTGGRIDTGYSSAGLRMNQDGRTFWLTRSENTSVAQVVNADSPDDLMPLVDPGAMELVKKIDIVGGDVLSRRAFERSSAANASALAAELMVARDYRTYLDNTAVINALMAAQPESAFTAGWVLTLLKARELNLDTPSAQDFQHGIAAQLGDAGLYQRLDFAPSFDGAQPDTLVLRHESGAEWRRDNAFGTGATHDVAGTAGDDSIHLADQPIRSAIHAAGGAGADTIGGSNGTDLIDGGAGNDSIDGREGHDWLHGGEGDDTLLGGGGDDLVVGGRGNDVLAGWTGFDTLVGGEGSDTVVIDVADRRKIIVAPALGQSGQTDTIWLRTHNRDQVSFARNGTDLDIVSEVPAASPVIATVKDFFLSRSSIDWFHFADELWRSGAEAWTLAGVTGVVEEYAALDGGGIRHFWLDGNNSQPWTSVVTDTNVWGQTVSTTWYYDDGTMLAAYGEADNVIRGDGSGTNFHGNAGQDQFLGSDGEDWFFGDDGHDTFFGGAGNDHFDAGPGNDRLDGGAGADIMSGASGDDSYVVDSPGDVVNEAGGGNDTVRAALSYALGNGVENLTLAAGAGAISGWGNALDNWIEGNESANNLYGEGGADTLVGGAGDDYYLIENSADRAIERPGEGRDAVHAWASFTLGAEIEVLALGPGAGAISGWGNALDNWIEGNESANNLYGEGGADTLVGGGGDDTYHIDNPGDSIIEHAHHGNDTARVSVSYRLAEVDIENLVLVTGAGAIDGIGNAMNNTLTGNESANGLDGLAGADVMAGGAGDDTYHIDNPGDSIIEHAHHGNDTARVSISYRLAEVDIENLLLVTGAGAITGVGNAMNNTLTGNESANGLDGLAGADVMAGGAGDDTYHVDNPGDMVIEHGGAGYDTVRSTFSYGLAAEVEALLLLGSAVDGVGNGLANTITGNAGDNGLDGLGGADILIGGAGVDRYYVDNPGDQVVELPDEGIDWVRTTVSYTLGANAEILLLLEGAGAINGVGNALDNWIGGNESANLLYGGGGGDTMEGGAGDDYYHVENSGDWAIERPGEGRDLVHSWVNFTLGDDIEVLALGAGAGAINGVGNGLDNWIGGNESANNLYGGGGGDTMEGGAGDDYYHVENSGDWAIERPGEGTDLVHSWVNFTLGANIEYLALGAGAGAINGVGNALDNWIGGNESANNLYGGGGGDTMEGGAGDDYYHVENSGDWVIERPGEGRDLVHSWVNFTLGADIELLSLGAGAGAINGVGNALDNWIGGNESANLLYGGSGGDTMEGGGGDDYYHVENSGDWAIERPGEGRDLVHSWVSFTLGNDIEYLALGAGAGAVNGVGNALDNWIVGNESANLLYGGGGGDTMEGGAGDDRLAGDEGTDAAVFSGARLDYAVTFDAATQTYTVTDRRAGAPDGSDSVTGVELFLFADRTVYQWELVG